MKELGIYIHIPFCKSKCNYCDFNSFANKQNIIESYVKALQKELIYVANKQKDTIIKTIYIGGGTPSFIDKKYIQDIIGTLKANFEVDKKAEITIEINPGTVDYDKMQSYYELGINRLSIGLQTSKDNLLKLIGRLHNYEQFKQTIEFAKKAGFENINSDMMIGLPNQTIYDVEDTVNKLINFKLTHISVYSLIIEEGTKIEKDINNGKLKLPDEEMERYMYWFTKRKLEENGYIHYEISNFSKIQYRSKHNLDCWNQNEYIGVGLSASSYENSTRYKNIDDIEEYIKNISNNTPEKNIIIEEKQDRESKMKEYMLLGLRKINGVNINKFRSKFKASPLYVYNKELTKLIKQDLIIADVNNIRLSKKGLNLANIVWEEFV